MYIDFTICSNDTNFNELKKIFSNSTIIYKGELLKNGKRIPYNEFNLVFEQQNIVYVNDLITSFKNTIGKKIDFLSGYIKSNQLNSSFCVVIKEDERPAISIENENLIFLCRLNATIDFDFI